MRTNYTSQDVLSYTEFNSIANEILTKYQSLFGENISITKTNGSWLYAEEIAKLEEVIRLMAIVTEYTINNRTIDNMTYIDYNDFNRWGEVINQTPSSLIININDENSNILITEDNNNLII